MGKCQSLQRRMIHLMVTAAAVPVLILAILLSVISWKSDMELADKQCESILDAIEADVLLQKKQAENVIRSLADSEAVKTMLTASSRAEWATRFNEGAYSELTKAESYLTGLQASVTLIYASNVGLECWPMLLDSMRFAQEEDLTAFLDSEQKDIWAGVGAMIPPSLSHIELYQSVGEKLVYYCRVTSGYRKQLGVIKCGLSVDRVLRTADVLTGENEIIVTVSGRIFRDPQGNAGQADSAIAPDRDGWHQRIIESLGMSIYVRRSMRSICEAYWRNKGVFLVLALLAIAVMLAATSSVRGSVVKRLRRLEQLANGIEIRESIQLPDEGSDEVGCVVRAFNSLFARLERKNAELLQKERDKRHSQLQALQYQLNPHFLFNSLHWLQLRLEEQGVDSETSESITQLGSVLRYNLSESLEATLAQEADQLRAYVGFMSEMKEQPIELQLAWPEKLNSVKVLRFVLQPLVENALRHGLIRGRSMLITVSAVVGGGWLTIRVENDGRSIDPQTLARLRTVFDSKTSDTAAGIGLNNLVYRLSLRYGRHYQLEVESGEGCTAFIIRIPEPEKSRQEEGDAHAVSGG